MIDGKPLELFLSYYILVVHISPGIQESTYVPLGVIDDIIRKLEAQASNSVNILNNVLESKDLNPKMLSFNTFQVLTEDSTEIKQNWENMYPINIEEFKCQVLSLQHINILLSFLISFISFFRYITI